MEALEEPDANEQKRDVLEVDCGQSLTQVQKKVVKIVKGVLANDQ